MLRRTLAGALLFLAVAAAAGAWLALEPSAPHGVATAALPPEGKAPEAKPTPVAPPRTGPVVTITPSGDEVPRLATVRVAFRDVPRLADAARLVSIEPAIEGSFVWDGDRTLLFQPAFPGWQRGQRYELLINGATAGLVRDFTFAFTVEGALEVDYVIPGDGDVEVPTEAQILVQFNRSVAALTVLQEGDPPPVLEFDPPLAGKGEWLNTSLYRFVPTDLRPATSYRVRIPAGLTSAADGVLESDVTWTFETIQPAVARFEPADGTEFVEPDGPFVVTFNQPMDRASVEAGVELRPESGEPDATTIEWSEGDTVATLTPHAPLTLGVAYEVVVPAGLAGAEGSSTQSLRVANFKVVEPPRLVRTEPQAGETDVSIYQWITLHYNNPMDVESFDGRVSVTGIDPDDLEFYDNSWSPGTVTIRVRLDPATEYTVRIAAGVRDRGGRTLPAHAFSFTTEEPDVVPWLSFAIPASFATLSASGEQVLYYHARHLESVALRLYRLSDAEAETLLRRGFIDGWSSTERKQVEFSPGSDPIRTWTVDIEEDLRDTSRLYSIALGDGEALARGHYFLTAEYDNQWGSPNKAVLSVVDTAIVTKLAFDGLLVWALDYDSGEPLEGVTVRTAPLEHPATSAYQSGTTDAEGLARFAVATPDTADYWNPYGQHLVRIDEGGRSGVAATWWDTGASPRELGAASYTPGVVGHVYTDRPIYRPGETVYFKAVMRDDDDATYSVPAPDTEVTLEILDPRYQTVLKTTAKLDELGTIASEFDLPAGAATGTYWVSLLESDGEIVAGAPFVVAEFRAPEFEVEVETAATDYVAGDAIATEAAARFYFGGPLGDAGVHWAAQASPTTIRVEGYERYSFSEYDYYYRSTEYRDPLRASGEARTDASGVARFEAPAVLDEGEGTQQFTISATVTDANGQSVAGAAGVTVHPATWYAGIATASYIARAEEPLAVQLVTVDFERTIAPQRPVTVRIFEREWVRTKERTDSGGYSYRYEPVDTEIQMREVTTDDAGEASFEFAPPTSGSYRLVAESTDDEGRVARSARFVWVSGRDHAPWPVRDNDIIELIADRDEYEVGDVAEVLVPAPFAGATALVTTERGRVLSSEVRTFETNSEVLRIPIEDTHIPNIFVGVVLYRAPTEDDPYPRYLVGTVELSVSTAPRHLDVRVEPDRDAAAPGETVQYEVTVTDAEGVGVAADVSVAIVDKAVLALAFERGLDGMESFWFGRVLGVHTASSLSVQVDRWNETYRDAEAGEEGEGSRAASKRSDVAESAVVAEGMADTDDAVAAPAAREAGSGPRVRSDFRNTALWIGQLTTGDDGSASFELRLPDNTTTWRALARATTAATQVGDGESELLVTQALIVRPALPRFLRVGDSVMLRTLVRNGTDEAREVTVTIEANGVTLDATDARSATIEPGDSAIFEWPARAVAEGTAVVRFRADASGGYADAVEISLPVHLDVTPETTATGGVVEDTPAIEAVYLPDYVITGSGSLEIGLQGSLVGALDEELAHFKPYRYESVVRVASRVVAAVAVQRATLGGLDVAQRAQLDADVQTLLREQAYWGGWGWCQSCETNIWVTGWALIALGEARDTGATVPDDALANASRVVSQHVSRPTDVQSPADPNQHAYLLYALADASNHGREVGPSARGLASEVRAIAQAQRADLTNWGRAYLLLGLLASGHDADHTAVRALLNDLTASTIASANGNHWEDPRTPGSMHNANVRITAIVLRALTEVDPHHPLIEETARWLALARSADRWKSSVERAQGMASLGAYAGLTGETRGVYDYSVLVNTSTVLDGDFDVPAGDYLDAASVALADLPLGEVSRVQFERETGTPGRLYYGLNLRYVTPAAGIEALNRGFAVSHRYSLLDDPETPVTSAAIGDVVRVTVTVVAPADRLFVQVEDSLPAGLEPIDPQLQIVPPWLREQLREEQGELLRANAPGYCAPWYGWCFSPWGQVDLRDDRLVLQASRLQQGVHEYVYYARATAPGDFFVAPARAEETYFPEVFGRSDSSRFTILGE